MRTQYYYETLNQNRHILDLKNPVEYLADRIFGIDRTYSDKMLRSVASEKQSKMPLELKNSLVLQAHEFNKRYSQDWLLQILHQTHGQKITSDDLYYFSILYKQIMLGEIFMAWIPLDDFAFSDANKVSNIKNLQSVNIEVSPELPHNSDGFYSTSEITLVQLEKDDYCTQNTKLAELTIDSISGCIEFGYNSLAKSCAAILMGLNLLRVPYLIRGFNPFCAIFFNTNPSIPTI